MIMKWIVFLSCLLLLGLWACNDEEEGYLLIENAMYEPDTLVVHKIPDAIEDSVRIAYKTPWISLAMQRYEGTQIILFDIASVTSTAGDEAAALFQSEVSVRGGGILQYPYENKAPVGRYTVSVRLTNPSDSQVLKDAFTFILE